MLTLYVRPNSLHYTPANDDRKESYCWRFPDWSEYKGANSLPLALFALDSHDYHIAQKESIARNTQYVLLVLLLLQLVLHFALSTFRQG